MPTVPRRIFDAETGGSIGNGGDTGPPFSHLVAPSDGDYSTVQDAINDNLKEFYIEGGNTYTETLTFDESCQRVVFGPGAIISGNVSITASWVTFDMRCGSEIQGSITISARGFCCLCDNNNQFTDVITASASTGRFVFFDGGGYATQLDNEFQLLDDNGILNNFSIDTKTGATTNDAIDIGAGGADAVITGINIIDSDGEGIATNSGAFNNIVSLNTVQVADLRGIEAEGERKILTYNNIAELSGGEGIDSDGGGDDSVWSGNIVADTIQNASGDNDQVHYGNRAVTVTDNDSTATQGGNNTGAF